MLKTKVKSSLRLRWWFDRTHHREVAAWLEDLNRNGWILKKHTLFSVIFEWDRPGKYRYQCISLRTKESQRLIEASKRAEWEDLGIIHSFHVFRRPEVLDLPEYQDEQDRAYLPILKRSWVSSFVFFALLAFVMRPLYSDFLLDLMLWRGNTILLMLFILVILLGEFINTWRLWRRTKKQLPFNTPVHKTLITQKTVFTLKVITVILMLTPLITLLNDNPFSPRGVPEESQLTVVRISEVMFEQGPVDVLEEDYRLFRSPFVPRYWRLQERWRNSDGTQYNFYSERYRALTNGVAKQLANLFIAKWESYKVGKFISSETHEFDGLWVQKTPAMTQCIVLYGKDVYRIEFWGHNSEEEIIEALRKKILNVNTPWE